MKLCLEPNTLARWSKVAAALLCAAIAIPPAQAATRKPTKKTAAKVKRAASKKENAAPKAKAAGAAALLALAQKQLDQGNLQVASDYASRAAKEAPELADYANYVRADANSRLHNADEVIKAVAHVLEHTPVSPLTGPAAALAVQADLDSDKPKEALDMIRKFYARIPQPQADFLLARSFQATGDPAQAAEYFQRVYYGYPKSKEAADASNSLNDLKLRLGENYPPPMPNALLGRAMKLIDARDYVAARNELNNAIPQLGGAQKDIARVRLGEVDFFNHDYTRARNTLESLQVSEPDADAERLDYLARSVLKLDRSGNVDRYLDLLAQKYPHSSYRLDILLTVGNQALVDNDVSRYNKIFSDCVAAFPNDRGAAWCHWRLTFEHYRRGTPGFVDELRSYVAKFPSSVDANAALYYLGRAAEAEHDLPSARAWYGAVVDHYPNTYYGLQSRRRIEVPTVRSAEPSAPVLAFLRTIDWPPRPAEPSFTPDRNAQKRLSRSRLLHLATLDDWAELELRFAARNDSGDPFLYAYELAKVARDRGSPDGAIRYVKSVAPSYLLLGLNDAPLSFWNLAFPLPYRQPLETYSKQNNLDPYLVAALIRQESEFKRDVISHAHAYGLMQVLPSTGRQLARQHGIRRFSANDLLTANRNLQLGTIYFRWLLDALNGHEEEALAAYNAGKSRVDRWSTWGPFREPSEFVETIPFQETRNYVQVVLRNADVYRRLDASKAAAEEPEAKSIPTSVRKQTTTRKRTTPRRGNTTN